MITTTVFEQALAKVDVIHNQDPTDAIVKVNY